MSLLSSTSGDLCCALPSLPDTNFPGPEQSVPDGNWVSSASRFLAERLSQLLALNDV